MLGGFTAKEALEAGFRDAVMDAAEGHPGKVDATPLIAPDFVDAYLRQQDEAPSPSWRRAAERRPGA